MKSLKVFCAVIVFFTNAFAQEEKIDEKLKTIIASTNATEFLDVIIELNEQSNFDGRHLSRAQVVSELMQLAGRSQTPIRQFLEQKRVHGSVESFKPYYIFNGIWTRCQKSVIDELIFLPAISKVYSDEVIVMENQRSNELKNSLSYLKGLKSSSSSYWWNILKIGADKVRDNLQLNGAGILVGVIDHGFSPTHPDLSPRWKSLYGWKDFSTGSPTPFDDGIDGHGTWITGTIVAGNSSGDEIGVAPGAQFISAKAFNPFGGTSTTTLAAMQWMLDPDDDGNPVTGDEHVPSVVNCSWGIVGNTTAWWAAVNNWVAAGIFPVFAAGNDGGLGASSAHSPSSYPQSFSVGSVNDIDVIAGYSGRGPITWPPDPPIIKPDVVAPSEPNVKACQPPAGYALKNGKTSTAAPHVVGAVALIKQAAPSLTISDIRTVLEAGAKDLGTTGKDNDYGAGRIDVYQSVLLAYAYSNKSVSSTATASNNGRRLVRSSDGKYHLVFESGITSGGNVLSEIYYRNSIDGVTWSTPVRLSEGNEQNRYPSIAEHSNKLYVVWQRKTGTNTYDLKYRRYSSTAWDNVQTINGTTALTSTNDPLPVIAISKPSESFEMMVLYRISAGLRSKRSTNSAENNWPNVATKVVTNNTSARNPSLVYWKDPDVPSLKFHVSWDDGSNISHQTFSGSSWGSPLTLSSIPMTSGHQFSSYAVTGSSDRHIVWQAFESEAFNRQVIYHNKNLTNIYTALGSLNWDHLRPSVTGNAGGVATVVCHETSSNKNIRKRRYNGTSWEGTATGLIVAGNGADASVSIANPPGATALAAWRSAASAPYTLTIGPSGGLSKENENETLAYHRRIVFSLGNSSTLVLQMGTVQLHSASGKNDQAFPFVSDQDSIKINDLAAALKLSNLLLSSDADSLVFEVKVYGQDAGNLRNDQTRFLNLAFDLLSVESGLPLASIQLAPLNNTGVSRQSARLVFPVQALRGRRIHLLPKASNLSLARVDGALVHVYEVVEGGAQKTDAKMPSLVAETRSISFSVRVSPNPFNPSAQIYFHLPNDGTVTVRVYDVNGRMIKELSDGFRAAGEHGVTWDGRDQLGKTVASGAYFSEVRFGEERQVAKMMLVR
jgi:hypothetical protein